MREIYIPYRHVVHTHTFKRLLQRFVRRCQCHDNRFVTAPDDSFRQQSYRGFRPADRMRIVKTAYKQDFHDDVAL